jgi:hypothetical protein
MTHCRKCERTTEERTQHGCAFLNPKRAGCPYFDADNKPLGASPAPVGPGMADPLTQAGTMTPEEWAGTVKSSDLAALIRPAPDTHDPATGHPNAQPGATPGPLGPYLRTYAARRPMPGDGGKSFLIPKESIRVVAVPRGIARYDGHDSLADMVLTHIESWRNAIKTARDATDSAYWDHELRALDKIEKACELDKENDVPG